MDTEHKSGNHLLSVENRKQVMASGVLDVDRFDEKMVVVLTNLGVLTVEGEDLHINRLNAQFFSELADWAYAQHEAMSIDDYCEMQDYENDNQ